jgi:hypothetical protein
MESDEYIDTVSSVTRWNSGLDSTVIRALATATTIEAEGLRAHLHWRGQKWCQRRHSDSRGEEERGKGDTASAKSQSHPWPGIEGMRGDNSGEEQDQFGGEGKGKRPKGKKTKAELLMFGEVRKTKEYDEM